MLHKQKGFILALFAAGILFISNHDFMYAENFEGKEDEMNAKCEVIKNSETQGLCRQYKQYLQNKSNNLDNEIKEIKNHFANLIFYFFDFIIYGTSSFRSSLIFRRASTSASP